MAAQFTPEQLAQRELKRVKMAYVADLEDEVVLKQAEMKRVTNKLKRANEDLAAFEADMLR